MTAIHCPRGRFLTKLAGDIHIEPLSWLSTWSSYQEDLLDSFAVCLRDTAALIPKQRRQPPVNRAGSLIGPGVDRGSFDTVSHPGPTRVNYTRSTHVQNTSSTNSFTNFASDLSGKFLRHVFRFIPVLIATSRNRTSRPKAKLHNQRKNPTRNFPKSS